MTTKSKAQEKTKEAMDRSVDSEVEIFESVGTAIEQIERAAIDMQIATAHQYPRSLSEFKKRATEMVTMDEETAQSCIYRRPVGKEKGKVVYAEGKSIRMAEIVGSSYGNIRVAAIIVEQTDRYVKCRGMAHDLESNFAASSEVIESTVTKDGKPYSERMRVVVAKACLAKARRDATFQVVPGALCKALEDTARKTAIGTTATLSKRRKTVLDWINKLDIDPARVYSALGINGIEDVGLKELEILTGIRTAIKDGDTNLYEAFPLLKFEETEEKEKEEKPVKEPDQQKQTTAPSDDQGKIVHGPIQSESEEKPKNDLFAAQEREAKIDGLLTYCKSKGMELKDISIQMFEKHYEKIDDNQLKELEQEVIRRGRLVV